MTDVYFYVADYEKYVIMSSKVGEASTEVFVLEFVATR